MSFFISDAMAVAGTAQGAQSDGTISMVMLLVICAAAYFMGIRPQNKRAKEHRELVNKLKKGDEIITSSGIIAKVSDLDEQYLKVAIATDIEITIQRQAVSTVLPKGTMKSL